MTNKEKQERIKVLELIYNQADRSDRNDGVDLVNLFSGDFERQGLTFDQGFYIVRKLDDEGKIGMSPFHTSSDSSMVTPPFACSVGFIGNYLDKLKYGDNKEHVGIDYYPKVGIGWANGKRFRIKPNQLELSLFNKLYRHIGEPVKRKTILGMYDRPSDEVDRNNNTYFINSLIKKIRYKTGLGANEVILNGGDATLLSQKLKKAPTK